MEENDGTMDMSHRVVSCRVVAFFFFFLKNKKNKNLTCDIGVRAWRMYEC